MGKIFRILSVDGGGVRGAFAATALKLIEQRFNLRLHDRIDMFAGTSTGSVIAAAIALDIGTERLVSLYENDSKTIFARRSFAHIDRWSLFGSRYSQETLRLVLNRELGDRSLGSLETPLIIPAVDLGRGCVHVLKSGYSQEFKRDRDVKIADAVLASCSAPLYFDPRIVGRYQLADGGLWANNPSVVALLDAQRFFGIDANQVRVLSIGTGTSRAFYPQSEGFLHDAIGKMSGWGFATRWKRTKLLDLILNLQSQAAQNTASLMMGQPSHESGRLVRLNFETDLSLPLDRVGSIEDLVGHADHQVSHSSLALTSFFSEEHNAQ